MRAKARLFPGPDFAIRERGRVMLAHLAAAPGLRMLDAGCGNGYFSLLACGRGLAVVAVSFDEGAVRRAESFRDFLGIPAERLTYRLMNLYDIGTLSETFDRIICLETLEHILDDEKLLRAFYDRLGPGGTVLVGVPNLEAPDFYGERISGVEDGGHVRKGYTDTGLEALLQRVGFVPVARAAYGGAWTRRAVVVQRRCHDAVAAVVGRRIAALIDFAIYGALAWMTRLDRWCSGAPMSVLVTATKPRQEATR